LHFLSHPLESIGLLPETFRAIKSEKEAFRIDKKIRDAPLYLPGKKAGLFLHTENTGLRNMEDVYRGRWWKEVPGLAASGRAYTTGLNLVRQTIFERFAKQMSLMGDGKLTDEDYKTTANFINNWTGRGGLGKLEMAARGLADIFFSPRLATSRFKVLVAPLTGFRAYGKSTKSRKLIAKEYARYLAGVATYWSTIYAGANAFLGPKGDKWDINFDILSSDFGKIRIGNTRIDPLSGLQQPLVLMARTLMGKKTTLKGKEVPLYGPEVGYGDDTIGTLMGRFVRSKFSPGMGVASDVFTRRHYFGEPINAKEMLYGVTPMVLRDTYESMNDMYNTFGAAGIPGGIVLGLMANVGEGIQTYEQKTKAERKAITNRKFLDWEPTKFMGTEIEKSLGLQ